MKVSTDTFVFCSLTLVLIIYFPTLSNSSFFTDDIWMIVDNPYLVPLDFNGVLTKSYMGQYSPINTFYYALLNKIFGLSPFFFHLSNILLHVTNSVLVFLVILKLVLHFHKVKDISRNETEARLIALGVGLLFAISPMQIETVSWVAASKILLYSFFSLCSILLYLQYLQTGFIKYYCIIYPLFLLAIGSKEQAVVLPVSLLLILLFTRNKSGYEKKDYLLLIPLFLISLVSGLVSMKIQDDGFGSMFETAYYPLYERFFLACYNVVQYIIKLIMPIRQARFYSFPMKTQEAMPIIFYLYFVILFCIILCVSFLKIYKRKYFYFGLLFFVANLFLSLHIFQLGRGSLIADRYVYLSSIGLFFPIVCFISDSIKFYKVCSSKFTHYLKWAVALYIGFVFVRSLFFVHVWSS